MTLSIAVQLVGGQADYLVKVSTPQVSTLHKLLTMCSAFNNLILAAKPVTVIELSLHVGLREASVCIILKQLQLKKICVRWVPGM